MFGRKGKDAAEQVTAPAAVVKPDGKGRPTPTRKEAEAARKASIKVPSDPKEAKKAMRDRDRDARAADRAALMAGDERRLPARDSGAARSMIRNSVDGRRSVGEIFIPVAILVLLSGFLRNELIIKITYYVWVVMLALVVLDVIWIIIQLRKKAKVELPDTSLKAGDYLYGVMRSLTLRRLRVPPPKFRSGGRPVEPKAPKVPKEPKAPKGS